MIRLNVPKGTPVVEPEVKRRAGGGYQRSRTGKRWRPSSAPENSGADWENAKRYFTFPTTEQWVARFTQEEDIWQNLLGDIYRETVAERQAAVGRARIGRRPRAIDGSMDELWKMVTPQYAMEPFAKALTALLESRPEITVAELARRSGLPRTTIRKMRDGSIPLDVYKLTCIAKAFDVSPSYFREFRESYVLTVMSELLAAKPNLSIRFARGITNAAERTSPVHRSAR